MADLSPLAQKVYGQLNNEYGPVSALSETERHFTHDATGPGIEQEEFALAFGLAYAIARVDHPFASDKELAQMAQTAATEAHDRFYGRPAVVIGRAA